MRIAGVILYISKCYVHLIKTTILVTKMTNCNYRFPHVLNVHLSTKLIEMTQ